MGVGPDPVVPLSSLVVRIDVYGHAAKMREMVQQLMTHLLPHVMTFRDRETGGHSHAHLHVKAMADPPGTYVVHSLDRSGVPGRVRDLV